MNENGPNLYTRKEAGLLVRLIAATGLANWPIFHRIMLVVLVGIFTFSGYQAWYAAANGTYRVASERVIDAPAEALWDFVTQTENRVRWQAYIPDMTRMKGEPLTAGSTRLLVWRDQNRRRWTAYEETVEVVPGMYFVTNQRSEKDERSLQIRLEPLGDCRTRVVLEERIRPTDYYKRLIAPFTRLRDKARFTRSFNALARWTESASCTADQP